MMVGKQSKILIVDKDDMDRNLLYDNLAGEGYQCYKQSDARKLLDDFKNKEIDMVILDVDVSGISAVELLPKLKASYPGTAIITTTPVGSTYLGIESLKLGAHEYVTKPLISQEVSRVVSRTLEKRRLELITKQYEQYLKDTIKEQTEQLRGSFIQAITALSHALEAKDRCTSGHSKRVAKISTAIAKDMCLSHESIDKIYLAGLVHDIGKIGVSELVLSKPGSLTFEELQHIQSHPEIGEHILAPIINDTEISELVRDHHERYDGTGYPDRLNNIKIPLGARILAVADAYDAMISERPYRKAMNKQVAYAELEQNKGTQFDPEVVKVFLNY
ncbi:HD domain-containing phosphohydrolase [Chloroflexota bacterium]